MNSITIPKLYLRGKSWKVTVPSSKSIANRVLILAALRRGITLLKGDFDAEDIRIMMGALKQMGIRVLRGIRGIRIVNDMSWKDRRGALTLDIGNSGTSIRFLTSLVCLRNGTTILTGKPRMMERPIGDLVDALRQMEAEIEYLKKDGFPPLRIIGHGGLKGGKVKIKADVSSQFLTSIMLIASACDQKPDISVAGKAISQPYIRMTKSLIRKFSARRDFAVEGDASAAVYWWALGFLHGCKVKVSNVPKNSIQGDAEFLSLLKSLDSGPLTVDMNAMPDASLMLMAIAPFLKFPIKIVNIGSLRVKETDRIDAMATELGKIGVKVKTGKDWIRVWPLHGAEYGLGLEAGKGLVLGRVSRFGLTKLKPKPKPSYLTSCQTNSQNPIPIHTYDDHRIAMSMAILGTKLGNLEILDPDCVKKTYPGFWDQLRRFSRKALPQK